MDTCRIRLVTCAWGKHYVDKLLDFTLASALAPGNLPALAQQFPCELAIVTEEQHFDYIRAHPTVQRMAPLCALRLLPLDDLITERWQYGMSLAYALFRGVADVGPGMTGTFFLFLNSDFILADGSYRKLIPHILRGERALLAPSYCANEESVRSVLASARDSQEGVLSMPPRRMAQLVLAHAHNTVRAKTVNQDLMHFQYMDQFYWKVDAATLIGHQMPVSLVGLRPERALADIETFWDWGLVYDFCPSRRLTVLGDSDDFLMLELRGSEEHRGSIFLGKGRPDTIASRMTGYITQYQIDNARFELTLHAGALPPSIAQARAELRGFRDRVLRCLPVRAIDHRNHEQWLYQKDHLLAFGEKKKRRAETESLQAQLASLERECQSRLQRIESSYGPRLEQLRQKLRELAPTRAELEAQSEAWAFREAPDTQPASRVTRVYRALFGRMTRPRPWHPYYLPYRPVWRRMKSILQAERKRVLLICEAGSAFAQLASCCSASVERITPSSAMIKGVRKRTGNEAPFDACLIDLAAERLPAVPQLMQAIRTSLDSEAVVVLHCLNRTLQPVSSWGGALAGVLTAEQGARLHCSGSPAGRRAIVLMNWCYHQLSRRSLPRTIAAAIGLTASFGYAMLALLQERAWRGDAASLTPEHCTAITVEIAMPRVRKPHDAAEPLAEAEAEADLSTANA
jgi:hypothetical protein